MARKAKSSNIRSRAGSYEKEDDTKFYIKFKDPRSKSQIFYYFDEEDIFDPCIPLNHGDIVSDSSEVTIDSIKPPEKVIESKRAPAPNTKPLTKGVVLPYFEDSTLQVQTANILPSKKDKPAKIKHAAELDDNFEDVGYMTAMDLNFATEEEAEEEIEKYEEEKKAVHEEEEFHELEEYVEPVKKPNRNILQLRTAMEPVGDTKSDDFVMAISLTKEDFDKNSAPKECEDYKNWVDCHLTKNSMPARQISATEFRLLKKLIGLKTK